MVGSDWKRFAMTTAWRFRSTEKGEKRFRQLNGNWFCEPRRLLERFLECLGSAVFSLGANVQLLKESVQEFSLALALRSGPASLTPTGFTPDYFDSGIDIVGFDPI